MPSLKDNQDGENAESDAREQEKKVLEELLEEKQQMTKKIAKLQKLNWIYPGMALAKANSSYLPITHAR